MNDQRWAEFEAHVKQFVVNHGIVGVAVAVEQDGHELYAGAFGMRDVAQALPVTIETIFGCASVTKSFTALAITQLADEGRINIDDAVVKHLPEFRVRGLADQNRIKVKHLLSHTTGLPPVPRHAQSKTWREHMEYLATTDYRLLGEPGAYFSYCNDTFLLLGGIIERISGMSYRDYMTEKILKPIGLQRTTYDINMVPVLGDYTELYTKNPQNQALEVAPWTELGLYEVGGGIRSNVKALTRYGRVFVNNGVIDERPIVSASGLKNMLKPIYRTGINTSYCFALQTTPDYAGVTLYEHGGGQPGVSSHFGFVPEKKLVVSVLINVTGVPADSLWLYAVNTALVLPILRQRVEMPTLQVATDSLSKYVGEYKSGEGTHLHVLLSTGNLVLEMNHDSFVLKPSFRDIFTYTLSGQERTLKFYMDGQHKPWAVFIGSRMIPRVLS